MPAATDATPAALADEWRLLMCSAEEPDISGADRRALIEQADTVLTRLAEIQTNSGVVQAAQLLFRFQP